MEDLENIFANIKLNSDNATAGNAGKYFEEIDFALTKNETTTKWIDELGKQTSPVTDEEFNKLYDKLKNDSESNLEGDRDSGTIRYSVVELIAKKCLQVEIKIHRNEFEEASSDAMAIVKFINKHRAYYAEKEYMVGFRYVAHCLAIKAYLKNIRQKNEIGKVNVSRLKELLEVLNEYHNFGIHPQVGVFAIKQYFAGYLRKGTCHDFQLRIIRKLVKNDPENLEWRFCLYSVLRFKRTDGKYFSAPSQEEIDVINEANEKRYAMFDARICLGYAFCLAEILKTSGKIRPIRYGKAIFYNEEEVLQCIRAKVDDVLAIDPMSVRSNIDVAKIYSTLLPPVHRDIAFAMLCIKRALMFNPNSSKANHRMAILLMSTNSLVEAVEYLQKAIENDERNIFATIDLLKVYMGNIPRYKSEIEQIFSNPTYKGYTHWTGNLDESVDLLIAAVTYNTKCIDSLERMHSNFKRCKWGDYNYFSRTIKYALNNRMDTCRSREESDILNLIWKALKDGNEYRNKREQFKPGRGKSQEDFFNRSHRSYRSGGSSYDSGKRENNTGGSRPGSSNQGYENENKGGGSQAKCCIWEVDDYDVLRLSKSATLSDVKKQYHKLAREHHPDKNMDLSTDELFEKQEKMKRINSAYHNLSTKIKS